MEKVARSRGQDFVSVVKVLRQKFWIFDEAIDKGTARLTHAFESHQRLRRQPRHNLRNDLYRYMASKTLHFCFTSKESHFTICLCLCLKQKVIKASFLEDQD